MIVAVADTNVIIHAIFHEDKWAQNFLKRVRDGEIRLAISEDIVNEYGYVYVAHCLEAQKGDKIDKITLFRPLKGLLRIISLGVEYPIEEKFNVFNDPDDNKFYDCAYEANALYIVSTDPHLYEVDMPLKNKSGQIIKVVSPYQLHIELNALKMQRHFNSRRLG